MKEDVLEQIVDGSAVVSVGIALLPKGTPIPG